MIITFETARLTKEKGFKSPTLHYYFEDEVLVENALKDIVGMDYGAEYEVEFSKLLENWNDNYVTKKDGSRCFGCSKSNVYFETYSAPTQSQLQKWLREVHNIELYVQIEAIGQLYQYVLKWYNNVNLEQYGFASASYEASFEAGLLAALNLIK